MIKLVSSLPDYGKADIAFAKICCNYAAYGEFDKIALFWAQTDESGKALALLSLTDKDMIITENGADIAELNDFLNAVKPESVFCETALANKLGLKAELSCVALKAVPPYITDNAAENTLIGISALYDRIKDEFNIPNKDAFLADISHRIRHNAAFYVTGNFSAAICFFSDDFAVINGISVDSEKRKTGLGSATLRRLLQSIRHRTVFVCTKRQTVPFYLKNNFAICGEVSYCKINGE